MMLFVVQCYEQKVWNLNGSSQVLPVKQVRFYRTLQLNDFWGQKLQTAFNDFQQEPCLLEKFALTK